MTNFNSFLNVIRENWMNMKISMNGGEYMIYNVEREGARFLNSSNNLIRLTENQLTFINNEWQEIGLSMEDFLNSEVLRVNIDYELEEISVELRTTGFFPVER